MLRCPKCNAQLFKDKAEKDSYYCYSCGLDGKYDYMVIMAKIIKDNLHIGKEYTFGSRTIKKRDVAA